MNTNLTPLDWARRPIQNYANFAGRAPRAEYWWFTLAVVVASFVISIIEGIVGLNGMIWGTYGPLTLLLWLATLVPSIAVGVRRLHDTNRSGWWLLLPLVPYCLGFIFGGAALMRAAESGSSSGMMASAGVAGIFMIIGAICALVLLVFMVLPSTPGDNRYGPNPYGEGANTVAAE
jgi:uncharacterized membrane protein YhaH (DUF805 family)